MADYKKTKNGLFSSAKARVILLITITLTIVAVITLGWKYFTRVQGYRATTTLTAAPSIESIPGAGDPSEHYVKTQNIENATINEQARKEATSAVPTITRSSFVGSTSAFEDSALDHDNMQPSSIENTAPNTCPASQVIYMYKPNPANCSVPNLKLARQAGVTAQELRCQACACSALRLAGFTAGELKSIGYAATDLKTCGFDLAQLVNAGFSAKELAAAGFKTDAWASDCDVETIKKARASGVDAAQFKHCGVAALKAAGFSAAELKQAGFSAAELAQAGFTPAQLRQAGFSEAEIAAAEQSSKDCSISALKKARASGISAVALKTRGCGVAALKAAGFTAAELKNAGFSAAELKAAGFSAKELKDAGFSARDLRDAGFSAAELKKAGFDAAALKNAGFSAGELKEAGFSAADLRKAGFSAAALHDAGFSAAELKAAGVSAEELKKAGYTSGDLLRAGFTAAESGFAEPGSGSAASSATGTETGINRSAHEFSDFNNNDSKSNKPNNASGIPSMGVNGQEERLSALANAQQKLMNQQQRQDAIQQTQGQMIVLAQKLMAGWSTTTPQVTQEAVPQVAAVTTTTTSVVPNGGGGANANGSNGNNGPVIKAGTIMFGVRDTSVNSDENTPVMATVVSGKLKGSKLLGNFTRVDKRLLIKFTTINVPHFDRTFTGNVVAIDSNTARTALSGYVDNHYMLRYGSLFASSFVAGVSQGIMQSGATVGGWPVEEVTYNEFTPTEYVALGLGNMGQQYANTMSGNFKTPPTVQIPGGTAIGLLFMEDVTLPQEIPQQRIGTVTVVDDRDGTRFSGDN